LLDGRKFIDGDQFFLKIKPKVTLSNGEEASNWDTPDAVDWDRLNETVKEELSKGDVVLVTFLPMIERYEFIVDHHVRLTMGLEYTEKCIDARIISKKIPITQGDGVKASRMERDELMVKEFVIPLYEQMLKREADATICVYNEGWHSDGWLRRTKEDLVNHITSSFENRNDVSVFVCAACLGNGKCRACDGKNPQIIVKGKLEDEKWTYGQQFMRIDEGIYRGKQSRYTPTIIHRSSRDERSASTCIRMYLCATCCGEKRMKNSTGCRHCNKDNPKMIVAWTWIGETDTWECSEPFHKTIEWVSQR
jgi:hypothetical protein